MAKRGAELISPSLLANIPKCSQDHKQLCLDMGEWTESSDESSTESETTTLNLAKKRLKLNLPKEGQENRWQFVDEAKEAALQKKVVPKNTTKSTKQPPSNRL